MSQQTQSKIDRPYIGLEEACLFLSISKATMYQRTMRKTIPFYKIDRKILFKVSELDAYIESHRVKTQSEIETEALESILSQK